MHGDRSATLLLLLVVVLSSACRGRATRVRHAGTKFPPDGALLLTESFHQEIVDHSFGDYREDDLYSSNSNETDGFTANGVGPDGASKCTASLILRPAKTGGRLTSADLDHNPNGIVVARIDHMPRTAPCKPIGFYRSVGLSGSAVMVARASTTQSPNPYEARIGPLPYGDDTVVATFDFCGHHPRPNDDAAKHYSYTPPQKPCDVAPYANARSSGADDSGESMATPVSRQDGALDFSWLGCSNDCCAAGQPPGGRP